MKNKAEFMNKLSGLVSCAKEQGNQITVQEVKEYFQEIDLTDEQMELVFDYLLSQKVVVKGYIKVDEQVEEEICLTEEELVYLEEYERDLKDIKKLADGERETLFEKVLAGDGQAQNRLIETYLNDVVEIAKEMRREDIFVGDLIQEGNVGLILGVAMLTDVETAHQIIVEQIRQAMRVLIEAQTELSSRDKKMVEKVKLLDESITTLTEELGRKVTIDELAVYMGMSESEIEDILKLTGEETERES